MRIESITIANLASLSGQQAPIPLSGETFGDAGLIAVTGPTGAGKSTIFDAVCLALYQQTPRLTGRGADPRELLSRGQGRAVVEVGLQLDDGTRWLCRWEARRARERADGAFQNVSIEIRDGDAPDRSLAGGSRDVSALVQERLGLSFDQFRAVVMLSQGEFARFLHEEDGAKADVLEKLTGTAIYTRLGRAAHERSTALQQEIEQERARISAIGVMDDDARAAHAADLDEVVQHLRHAAQDLQRAQRVADWWCRRQELADALAAAGDQAQEAEERRVAAAAQRDRLAAARRAVAAAAQVQAATTAAAALDQAQQALDASHGVVQRQTAARTTAQEALAQAVARADAMVAAVHAQLERSRADDALDEAVLRDLDQRRQDQVRTRNSLATAEAALAQRRQEEQQGQAERSRAQQAVDAHAQVVEQAQTACAAALQAHAAIVAEGDIQQLERQSGLVERAREILVAWQAATAQCATVQAAVTTGQQQAQDAEARCQSTAATLTAAQEAVAQQEQVRDRMRQLAGLGAFRELLSESAPCPLCGAHEHPAPLDPDAQSGVLQRAEAVLADLRRAVMDAEQAHQGAVRAHDAARSAASLAGQRLVDVQARQAELQAQWASLLTQYPDLPPAVGDATEQQITVLATALADRLQQVQHLVTIRDQAAERLREQEAVLATRREALATAAAQSGAATTAMTAAQTTVQQAQQEATAAQAALWQAVASVAEALGEAVPSPDRMTDWISALAQRGQARRRLCALAQALTDLADDSLAEARSQLPAGLALPACPSDDLDEAGLRAVRTALAATRQQHQRVLVDLNAATVAHEGAQRQQRQAQDQAKAAQAACDQALQANGFSDRAAWQAASMSPQDIETLDAGLQTLAEAVATARGRVEERTAQQGAHLATAPALGVDPQQADGAADAQADHVRAHDAHAALYSRHATLVAEQEADARRRQQQAAALEILHQRMAQAQVWHQLKELIGSHDGSRFRSVAQAMTLEQLLHLANHRLACIEPRYQLARCHDLRRPLALEVIDHHQADERRPIATLSGGETFLVSLALALALADLKRGQLHIGTLFIDEGFGTLDAATLDQAMSVLERLQAEQGTQILLISHVPALQERIPYAIQVERLGSGRSRLRLRSPDGLLPVAVSAPAMAPHQAPIPPSGTGADTDLGTASARFMQALADLGSLASATKLRRALGWQRADFERIREHLSQQGRIETPNGTRSIQLLEG